MTHCTKRRFAALGAALILLLLSGCQGGGGGVLMLSDGAATVPGIRATWQELLTRKLNEKDPTGQRFQYESSADVQAEIVLETMRSCSGNDAAQAEAMLKENKGYAVGAVDIRNGLGVTDGDKPRLVGYAILPQTDAETMSEELAGRLAGKILQDRRFITKSSDGAQTESGRVGFAMGEIGEETFVIAFFR